MAEDIRAMKSTAGIKEFEKQFVPPHCVVLDSEYCSMGRMIAYKACQYSGYAYYDAVILLELVPEYGVKIEEVAAFEQKLRKADADPEQIRSNPEFLRISAAFDKAIDIALERGPCLIHDRAVKEMVEEKGYTCISALTYAHDMQSKIVRAKMSPHYADYTDPDLITEKIREEDHIRINYHAAQSSTVWGNKDTYDILINTDAFGLEYSAVLLACAMKKPTGIGE